MSGFRESMAYVFGEEGGLADHPLDRGGRTKYGITKDVWLAWRGKLGKAGQPVDACTTEDAEHIYHRDYWLETRCDAYPWPLSLCVFDSAVQHGPKTAIKLLQRALAVEDDGIAGPITLRAAGNANTAKMVRAMIRARMLYYRAIWLKDKSQRVFAPSWMGRVYNLWVRCAKDYPEAA